MRRAAAFACVLFILTTAVEAQQSYRGRPLGDVLRELGVTFDAAVVTPEMMVSVEPSGDAGRIIEELLAEHGLCLSARRVVRCMPVALESIVVTPSSYGVYRDEPDQRQLFDREEVQRLPHPADDLFRALAYVPGTTASDISARFNIRGGEEDEAVVLLDGAEIYDPFHLRDLFRTFSTIDSEAAGSVDIITGGFPAEYGGRMSGVLDIATLTPSEAVTDVGLSILNTRVLTRGTTAGGGEWLLSARHGYLRELLKLVTERDELEPVYYDVLARYQRPVGRSSVASLHLLAAHDRVKLVDVLSADLEARYTDLYGWAALRSQAGRITARNVLTFGSLSRGRHGAYGGSRSSEMGRVDDEREARLATFRNDTTFALGAANLLKAGLVLRQFEADYDYRATATIHRSFLKPAGPTETIARSIDLSRSGSSVSAYFADRVLLRPDLILEAGLRGETETQTREGARLLPRLNLAWLPDARSSVRLAWGKYDQAPAPYELQVEDGVTSFGEAQRSEHRIVSFEYRWPRQMLTRLELYDKQMTRLRPRFENLYDRFVIFPELRPDRIRIAPESASARGAELVLRRTGGSRVTGWISYAWSRVTDRIEGDDVPRTWDQPHAVTFSTNFRAGARVNVNLAGTWHSGRPTTPVQVAYVDGKRTPSLGRLNSERFEPYRRVDLRVSRDVLAGHGGLSFFAEVFNVLNDSNVSRVDRFVYPSAAEAPAPAVAVTESVVGVVPTFGLSWRFR